LFVFVQVPAERADNAAHARGRQRDAAASADPEERLRGDNPASPELHRPADRRQEVAQRQVREANRPADRRGEELLGEV